MGRLPKKTQIKDEPTENSLSPNKQNKEEISGQEPRKSMRLRNKKILNDGNGKSTKEPIKPPANPPSLLAKRPPPSSPPPNPVQRQVSLNIADDEEFEAILINRKKKIEENKKSIDKGNGQIKESAGKENKAKEPVQHLQFKTEDFVREIKTERVEDIYYFIKPPLGTGLFGTVYKAKHRKTGNLRAIKRIKKEGGASGAESSQRSNSGGSHPNPSSMNSCPGENIESLLKDVDILKRLDHPNIIRIYEFFSDPQAYYIVTDLCSGGELFDHIIREKNFTEAKCARLLKQVLSALAYCHERNLVHCDIKPENIVFECSDQTSPDTNGPVNIKPKNLIKLIDFGSSSFCRPGERLSRKFGSVCYVAPEVLKSSYNEKCDIWSLGVVLFITLCGKPPFSGSSDRETLMKIYEGKYSMDGPEWEEISDEAKDLVKKMLTYDFNNRISARECLNHPWFVKRLSEAENENPSQLSFPIGRRSLRNLKTFRAESQLGEAVLYFVVNQLASKEEKEDLMEIFMTLDTDNDGRLNRQELLKAFEKQGEDPENAQKLVEDILENVDKEKKGSIDYMEFLTAALSKRRLLSEERLQVAFDLFDHSGQGFISAKDFRAILNKGAFANVEEDLWLELIRQCTGIQGDDSQSSGDPDNDQIDFETFSKMMKLFTQNEQITQSLAF